MERGFSPSAFATMSKRLASSMAVRSFRVSPPVHLGPATCHGFTLYAHETRSLRLIASSVNLEPEGAPPIMTIAVDGERSLTEATSNVGRSWAATDREIAARRTRY